MTFALRFPRAARHAIAPAIALVLATAPFAVQAQPPAPSYMQAPGYQRMQVGKLEITALYDGYLGVSQKILHGASPQDISDLIAGMFVPSTPEGTQTAVNGYLINTGGHLVLIDAGAAACFGPTAGALADNLNAAGYKAEQVDTILLTHLHGDHACGIATAQGTAAFPNATVYVSDDEAGFWLDPDTIRQAPQGMRPFFALAQKAVAPYAASKRLKQFNPGDTLLPGIKSWPLPGHTPGHGGYLFDAGGEQILFWGDIIHSHAVQFSHPEVSIEFDIDAKQAVATRTQVLAEAAARKLWIAGAHLPFPGIGHVRTQGENKYDWVPMEYGPLTGK